MVNFITKNLFVDVQKDTVAILCIVFVFSSLFSGCEKKSDLKIENEILYGKWQLKTISPLNAEGVDYMLVDYTPMNIIYEFKANNVLTVSGNVDNNYGGLEVGKHFYEVTYNKTLYVEGMVVGGPIIEINSIIPYDFFLYSTSDNPKMQLVMTCIRECNSVFHFTKK